MRFDKFTLKAQEALQEAQTLARRAATRPWRWNTSS